MTLVGVVIVTYNSAPLLAGLAASLPAGASGVDWKVAVVDNASADGSLDEARRVLPGCIAVQTGRNGGYAAGINAGVRALGECEGYLLLNPDVRLQPGCVAALCRGLQQLDAGVAVPRLSDGSGALIYSQRREPSLVRAWADAFIGAERAGRVGALGEVVTAADRYDHRQVTDWAEGSTQLVSAECWDKCGPWDESFFLYSEETEFALRARDRGFKAVYLPTAQAVHLEGDSAGSPGLWSLVQVNRARLYARRHSALGAVAFWAALVTREATRAALGKRTSQRALRALLSRSAFTQKPGPEWVATRG